MPTENYPRLLADPAPVPSMGGITQPVEKTPWIDFLVTFGVLLLFSWLGIALSAQSEGIATIWFTNGMLFGLIILRPRRLWVSYFVIGLVADTLADLLYGDRFALAFGVSVANSVEVILSVSLLTYFFGSPFNLSKRRPLLAFLGIAVIAATAVAGALAAWWTLLFVHAGPWLTVFRTWYLGDMLGMSIMAPLVFGLLRPGFFDVLRGRQFFKTTALLVIPALATLVVFTDNHDSLIFLIFPALLVVVFRLGFPGTVLTVCLIALISISLTVTGHGPLTLVTDQHILHRIVVVQVFLAVSLFTSFPVAALLEEGKELEESLHCSEARFRQLANIDGLTGVNNRRGFDSQLEADWNRAVHYQHPLAILMIDVDLFKAYNDLFGHLDGDDCLRSIARALVAALPPSLGTLSRYGGEEFAVILPNVDYEEALAVAEGLRRAVADQHLRHPCSSWGVQTISIGVAVTVPDATTSAHSLLQESDASLYCAKNYGRNRVESASSRTVLAS